MIIALEWVAIVLSVFLFGISWVLRKKDKDDFDTSLKKQTDKILENSVKLKKIELSLEEKPGILNFRPGEEPGDSKPVATRKLEFSTDYLLVYPEDKVLCANCNKPKYQHKECDYHLQAGGPCDCPKFEPSTD